MMGIRVNYLPGHSPGDIKRFMLKTAASVGVLTHEIVRKRTVAAYHRVLDLAPRASGAYADTIGMDVQTTGLGNARGEVGTNHPAARRLEFGFVGTDSRGRRYQQRPQPHFGPAVDAVSNMDTDDLLAGGSQ